VAYVEQDDRGLKLGAEQRYEIERAQGGPVNQRDVLIDAGAE